MTYQSAQGMVTPEQQPYFKAYTDYLYNQPQGAENLLTLEEVTAAGGVDAALKNQRAVAAAASQDEAVKEWQEKTQTTEARQKQAMYQHEREKLAGQTQANTEQQLKALEFAKQAVAPKPQQA